MRLSYKTSDSNFRFPLGKVESREVGEQITKWLHLGSITIQKSAQLSEAEVLAILAEVVSRTNAKIKIEFEDITLEFE